MFLRAERKVNSLFDGQLDTPGPHLVILPFFTDVYIRSRVSMCQHFAWGGRLTRWIAGEEGDYVRPIKRVGLGRGAEIGRRRLLDQVHEAIRRRYRSARR